MPTYDYECSSCGHRFEIFEKVHENRSKVCPKCGRRKAGRLLGAGAGVIFRGSGFHVTDYKKSGSGGAPKPPDRPSTPAPSKGEGAKKPAGGSDTKKP